MANLSPSQIQTFASHIEANPAQAVIDALADGNNNAIVAWYSQVDPAFWVFLDSVSTDKAREAIDWAEILAPGNKISAESRWAFDILTANGDFNPTLQNTRAGLDEIFSGFNNTRTALLLIATRNATEFEKVFAITATGPGGGNGSAQAQAAEAIVVGIPSLDNVRDAVALIGS